MQPARDLADSLLAKLGKKLSVADFVTDAHGLARLSVDKVGLIDFELYDQHRMLTMFVGVGGVPDDVGALLRHPLEYAEMAGFSFGLDGFLAQVFLQATVPVDDVSAESFHRIYTRFVDCAQYWQKNLGAPVQEGMPAQERERQQLQEGQSGFITV